MNRYFQPQVDVKTIQETMDRHAENIALAFVGWIHDNHYCAIEGGWIKIDCLYPPVVTREFLYKKFINEITCKNVNKAASVNSMQKPENR